ncbi:hypothetical protein J4232_06370 [Candidatus Woesearchaeota archaeon]|nr:hypothetical protein [Candidatus Woesearchaeota archaeon]
MKKVVKRSKKKVVRRVVKSSQATPESNQSQSSLNKPSYKIGLVLFLLLIVALFLLLFINTLGKSEQEKKDTLFGKAIEFFSAKVATEDTFIPYLLENNYIDEATKQELLDSSLHLQKMSKQTDADMLFKNVLVELNSKYINQESEEYKNWVGQATYAFKTNPKKDVKIGQTKSDSSTLTNTGAHTAVKVKESDSSGEYSETIPTCADAEDLITAKFDDIIKEEKQVVEPNCDSDGSCQDTYTTEIDYIVNVKFSLKYDKINTVNAYLLSNDAQEVSEYIFNSEINKVLSNNNNDLTINGKFSSCDYGDCNVLIEIRTDCGKNYLLNMKFNKDTTQISKLKVQSIKEEYEIVSSALENQGGQQTGVYTESQQTTNNLPIKLSTSITESTSITDNNIGLFASFSDKIKVVNYIYNGQNLQLINTNTDELTLVTKEYKLSKTINNHLKIEDSKIELPLCDDKLCDDIKIIVNYAVEGEDDIKTFELNKHNCFSYDINDDDNTVNDCKKINKDKIKAELYTLYTLPDSSIKLAISLEGEIGVKEIRHDKLGEYYLPDTTTNTIDSDEKITNMNHNFVGDFDAKKDLGFNLCGDALCEKDNLKISYEYSDLNDNDMYDKNGTIYLNKQNCFSYDTGKSNNKVAEKDCDKYRKYKITADVQVASPPGSITIKLSPKIKIANVIYAGKNKQIINTKNEEKTVFIGFSELGIKNCEQDSNNKLCDNTPIEINYAVEGEDNIKTFELNNDNCYSYNSNKDHPNNDENKKDNGVCLKQSEEPAIETPTVTDEAEDTIVVEVDNKFFVEANLDNKQIGAIFGSNIQSISFAVSDGVEYTKAKTKVINNNDDVNQDGVVNFYLSNLGFVDTDFCQNKFCNFPEIYVVVAYTNSLYETFYLNKTNCYFYSNIEEVNQGYINTCNKTVEFTGNVNSYCDATHLCKQGTCNSNVCPIVTEEVAVAASCTKQSDCGTTLACNSQTKQCEEVDVNQLYIKGNNCISNEECKYMNYYCEDGACLSEEISPISLKDVCSTHAELKLTAENTKLPLCKGEYQFQQSISTDADDIEFKCEKETIIKLNKNKVNPAIYIKNKNVKVNGCKFEGFDIAIKVMDTAENTAIINNVFTNNKNAVFSEHGFAGNNVVNMNIFENNEYAVHINTKEAQKGNLYLSQNMFLTSKVEITGFDIVIVDNNTFAQKNLKTDTLTINALRAAKNNQLFVINNIFSFLKLVNEEQVTAISVLADENNNVLFYDNDFNGKSDILLTNDKKTSILQNNFKVNTTVNHYSTTENDVLFVYDNVFKKQKNKEQKTSFSLNKVQSLFMNNLFEAGYEFTVKDSQNNYFVDINETNVNINGEESKVLFYYPINVEIANKDEHRLDFAQFDIFNSNKKELLSVPIMAGFPFGNKNAYKNMPIYAFTKDNKSDVNIIDAEITEKLTYGHETDKESVNYFTKNVVSFETDTANIFKPQFFMPVDLIGFTYTCYSPLSEFNKKYGIYNAEGKYIEIIKTEKLVVNDLKELSVESPKDKQLIENQCAGSAVTEVTSDECLETEISVSQLACMNTVIDLLDFKKEAETACPQSTTTNKCNELQLLSLKFKCLFDYAGKKLNETSVEDDNYGNYEELNDKLSGCITQEAIIDFTYAIEQYKYLDGTINPDKTILKLKAVKPTDAKEYTWFQVLTKGETEIGKGVKYIFNPMKVSYPIKIKLVATLNDGHKRKVTKIINLEEKCIDSDKGETSKNEKLLLNGNGQNTANGINYLVAGYVVDETGKYEDSCSANGKKLTENLCSGDSRKPETVDCNTVLENGICKNNACELSVIKCSKKEDCLDPAKPLCDTTAKICIATIADFDYDLTTVKDASDKVHISALAKDKGTDGKGAGVIYLWEYNYTNGGNVFNKLDADKDTPMHVQTDILKTNFPVELKLKVTKGVLIDSITKTIQSPQCFEDKDCGAATPICSQNICIANTPPKGFAYYDYETNTVVYNVTDMQGIKKIAVTVNDPPPTNQSVINSPEVNCMTNAVPQINCKGETTALYKPSPYLDKVTGAPIKDPKTKDVMLYDNLACGPNYEDEEQTKISGYQCFDEVTIPVTVTDGKDVVYKIILEAKQKYYYESLDWSKADTSKASNETPVCDCLQAKLPPPSITGNTDSPSSSSSSGSTSCTPEYNDKICNDGLAKQSCVSGERAYNCPAVNDCYKTKRVTEKCSTLSNPELVNHCFNNKKDSDEELSDCGGDDCKSCPGSVKGSGFVSQPIISKQTEEEIFEEGNEEELIDEEEINEEASNLGKYLVYGILALFVIVLLVVLLMKKKGGAALATAGSQSMQQQIRQQPQQQMQYQQPRQLPEMNAASEQQLKSYISKQLESGMAKETISQTLQSSGWRAEDVEKVFTEQLHHVLPADYEQKLQQYISYYLDRGMTREEVRAKLISGGWHEDVVDNYMKG